MRPRWHKVLRDLWGNKLRTVLVVLSIAVGVFAVGMVLGTSEIMFRELQRGYASIVPLEAQISSDPFDTEMLETARRVPGVKAVEGRRYIQIRVKIGPEEWQSVQLSAVDNFDAIQVNKIKPQAGAWPPPKRELLMERGSLGLIKAQIGDTVTIEDPTGQEREMRIAGTVHDINLPPAAFAGIGFGYVSMDTLEWFGISRDFNSLQMTVSEDALNKQHITDVADTVKAKIEKSGRKVYGIYVPIPGQHPAVEILQPIMLVLTVMGFLSLILSGFLVINTIAAIMAQQTRQIGIMKAVGARNSQVLQLYLATVIIFGLLSLLVAVPLGALAAGAFGNYMAQLINFDIVNYSTPPNVLAIEFAIGLIAPLLAALYPVLAGTRITVREAINSYGLAPSRNRRNLLVRLGAFMSRPFRRNAVASWTATEAWTTGPTAYSAKAGPKRAVKIAGPILPRPLLLSLRNTFRRKSRLALTLLTLTLAGGLFMGIFTVRDSLNRTLDEALQYWHYDVEIIFSRAYRSDEIAAQALQVPGVTSVESWGYYGGITRERKDGTQSDSLTMIAPPADTQLIRPIMVAGRWLQSDDENAVVVNTEILKGEPDIKLGDDIILKIDEREETWHVVGIAKGLMTGKIAYANYPYFAQVTRFVGRAFTVEAITDQHDAAFQARVSKDLERQFKGAGMRIRSSETIAGIRQRVEYQFNIMLVFLLVMVSLLALVGGLGLMGTMSINVLERTREIGVLRAIGAANRSIMGLVVIEGVLIGLLSWAAGVLLAYPLSNLLSVAVGQAMLQAPLSYTFSSLGPAVWLIVVIVLATIASLLPARNASRISVREALAYE
jgi:putative ABC transport system permease protein